MSGLDVGLTDRLAVVTGASRGIGRAIAIAMAKAGADVYAIARTKADLDLLGEEVEALGRRYDSMACDLTEPDAPQKAIDMIVSRHGSPSILVNSAGGMNRAEPPDLVSADIAALMALNVGATLLMCQAAAPELARGEGGAIVNVGSIAASRVTRASTVYSASKAAVVQMTRVLAMRLAPSVRVNAVGPGYVETDLNRDWLSDPENREYVLANTALQRLGSVDDVANAAVFLSSSAAAHITGQHLLVDGGWSA